MSGRPKIVVLGLMSRMPVAGAVWQTLHYLLGLELLGFDAYYVEAHACAPTMLMPQPGSDGSAGAAGFISSVMHRFGFDGKWAFHALHHDGRCYGMSAAELSRLYGEAACLINLHGGTEPLEEHRRTGRLVYIETDPVRLQFEIASSLPPTLDLLDGHCAYFTFAENWGRPGCGLPVTDRYEFRPTRQPVIVDLWETAEPPAHQSFTTVGNWDQRTRDIVVDGRVYGWSKKQQLLKLIDLPARSGRSFELALSKPGEDLAVLQAHGWTVRPAEQVSSGIDRYRSYVRSSRGEFTVAKEQNVLFRSGWFSDRSSTYLAAGRPVVTQDTGLDGILPLGEGLFAFSGTDDILAALDAIDADYPRHCRAASELAREFFDHRVVLDGIVSALGVTPGRPVPTGRLDTRSGCHPLYPQLPVDLVLEPVGKNPLELDPTTAARIISSPPPRVPSPDRAGRPEASVVVVTHGPTAVTRLCLDSVLINTADPGYELIVVDNASGPESTAYLGRLAAANPSIVRLILNESNEGFPRAANQGMAAAAGDSVVILNNDTIVPPGWLSGLLRHLQDPTVGMVGPVTNDAGNECRVTGRYRTYGEFLAFCSRRPKDSAGRDVPMLTMFCVALPRHVQTLLGDLDEGFGLGLFEDDDYAMRLKQAGYRCVCADDVFVHHFGRASFGALVPTGRYATVFEANRDRFERKWGVRWSPHAAAPDPDYDRLVERVRAAVVEHIPPSSKVAVASRGDERLVGLPGMRAVHFPSEPGGAYAGHYPARGDEAVRLLDAVREDGCTHLVLPASALWWLERYPDLTRHLDRHGQLLWRDECTAAVYQLEPASLPEGASR